MKIVVIAGSCFLFAFSLSAKSSKNIAKIVRETVILQANSVEYSKQVAIIDKLLKSKVDLDAVWYGYSALCYAVNGCNLDIIKKLINAGADVNYAGSEEKNLGNSNLHVAVETEDIETVRILLESGANLFSINFHDDSLIELAERLDNFGILNLLLEYGAKFHGSDDFSNSEEEDGHPDLNEIYGWE